MTPKHAPNAVLQNMTPAAEVLAVGGDVAHLGRGTQGSGGHQHCQYRLSHHVRPNNVFSHINMTPTIMICTLARRARCQRCDMQNIK